MQATISHPGEYEIKLPTYSGPLDLLLHLIERNELDITAISLVAVADQYLAQVEILREDDEKLESLMDFLIIGARLLVIKSRALLPQLPPEISDEEVEEDPAEALARQLRTYRRFKGVADWLQMREQLHLRTHIRIAQPAIAENILDVTGLSITTLVQSLEAASARDSQRKESIAVAVRQRVLTIEDQISKLRKSIEKGQNIFFQELLSEKITWLEISVTLLAVLELIKRNEITVVQPQLFGPIEILPISGSK